MQRASTKKLKIPRYVRREKNQIEKAKESFKKSATKQAFQQSQQRMLKH